MPKYLIRSTANFRGKYKKIVKYNHLIPTKVETALNYLSIDPFHHRLRSHKIRNHQKLGGVWSSRVTGDIRILWSFDKNNPKGILLLTIGDHDHVY